jgi:outer membrane lipoprotein-sorting protein
MKKLIPIFIGLLSFTVVSAQSIDDIIKHYTIANKLDKVTSIKTIKITGNMSMMGTDLPMTVWMKNPDKIKTVTTFQGQEMIEVFDGQKGYIINPMMGSTTPKEMTAEEIRQTLRGSIFQNYLEAYRKNGQLTLVGEESVNNKPAFKIKTVTDGGTVINFFIDKSSYLMVKISSKVVNNGMTIDIDAFPSDFKETKGLIIPMKTTTVAQGMEMVMNFTGVEIDIPIDDNLFKVKQGS